MTKIARNILIFQLLLLSAISQGQVLTGPYGEVETNTYFSTGEMLPFWIQSNQWGKYSPASNGNVTSIGLFSQPHDNNRDSTLFSIGYGLEASSRYTSGDDHLWLHQGYLRFSYKNLFRLSAGLWEETMGNQYDPLSSGGIIWSGNARPLPQVRIGTADYIKIPFTNGKLEGKALISHGWFEKDRSVNNALLHHKFVGLRTSRDFPLSFNFGFYHFAQWGGENDRYGQLPNDLEAFWRIFAVKEGGEEARENDQINKAGNHLGSRYLGIDWNKSHSTTGIYYQDIFEDGSGQRKRNFPDGLWGIYFENNHHAPLVKGVLYEWLYTADQSGPIHDNDGGLGGNDNYFNHGGYSSGWTTFMRTIGTPFITSPVLNKRIFKPDEPTNYDQKIFNNRVSAHHLGLTGFLSKKTEYKILGSFSRNKGLHDYNADRWRPEVYKIYAPRDQWSFRTDFKHFWDQFNLETSLSIAADIGEMYGDNFGVMLGVRIPLYPMRGGE
ncbi:MAG: capsule assembly Wzi family protein [Marinilabilia sp.]